MDSYENCITVKVPPNRIFDAVTKEMSNWWTEMTADIAEIGDKTTAQFEDGTTWSFEVVRITKNKLVELRCYEANHIHPVTTTAMQSEWENTVLQFEINENIDGTTIRFKHIGLTPELACYAICHSGWDHFFGSAFRAYLDKIALAGPDAC